MADDAPFEFSASAIKKFRQGCNLQFYFKYGRRISEPQGKAAAAGTAIHSEMEAWYEKQQVPTIKAAQRLLPLAPHPMHPNVLIEHEFRVLLPAGAAKGFIDLLIPKPDLKFLPADGGFSPDVPLVIDWKSTSRLDLALTEDELAIDPQGILYGVAARMAAGGSVNAVPDVDLMWCYTGTKQASAFPVKTRQSLPILQDGLGVILEEAGRMKEIASQPGPDLIEYDLRQCSSGYKCSYTAFCPRYNEYHQKAPAPIPDGNSKKEAMTVSILDKLAALQKQPMTVSTPAYVESVPAAATTTVKPSPEPELPKPDTSGIDAAAVVVEVLPPDAAPNLTEESAKDLGTEVVVKEKAEKKGRKPKAAKVERVESDTGDLETLIQSALQMAISQRSTAVAGLGAALAAVLND
jgi:hypothetical protein